MTEDKYKALIIIVGVICLSSIEVMAILNGMNGTVLSMVVGGITAIIGYGFGIYKRAEKTTTDTKKV